MKTIQLTPRQRNDIGDRRRNAQDRRVYQRLSAVLWSDEGRSREVIADLLGVSTRQVGQWLRIFRNKGLEELCTLHYQGDPGRLGPAQVERLKREIATGVFHNAEQVRTWVQDTLGVAYSISGIKDLLRRVGAVSTTTSFTTYQVEFHMEELEVTCSTSSSYSTRNLARSPCRPHCYGGGDARNGSIRVHACG